MHKTRQVHVRKFLLIAAALFTSHAALVSAQDYKIERPDREFLFLEDIAKKKVKKEEHKQLEERKKTVEGRRTVLGQLPFDLNAPQINYDTTGKKVVADGGLTLSYGTAILEAERGTFNLETKDADISGDVRITDVESDIQAESIQFNLDTGAGKMKNGSVKLEEGNYSFKAAEIEHLGNQVFTLKDAELSTCGCPGATAEDCPPWQLSADSARITREGYGHVWNATLDVHGVPVLYTPYLIFPAKTQRQSGLLPFSFGTGKENGFKVEAPLFLVLNESTDLTVTTIVETKTRVGADVEFRKAFSKKNLLDAGVLYLNESKRDGELRGTDVTGLFDPTLDTNRFGGFYDQIWQGEVGTQQFQLIVDGHFVSDDLLLREHDNEKIGLYNSRFVTSTAALSTLVGERYNLSLSSEFNQSIVTDDDLVFQRLPEVGLAGFDTFRAFGENPYGLKVVLGSSVSGVNFSREKGYDGNRGEIAERVKVPFHFKNYFDGELSADARATYYDLSETAIFDERRPEEPSTGDLPSSSDRFLPGLSAKIGTVLEQIYSVPEGNWFAILSELGPIGRDQKLVRIKHTLEPSVKYRFVPDVDQMDNPQFDSSDQLAQRNVVTYQLVQRIYGRYDKRDKYLYGIEENIPEVSDIENLRSDAPIDDRFAFGYSGQSGNYRALEKGTAAELLNFSLAQSMDIVEANEDNNPDRNAFSDIAAGLTLIPNYHVRLKLGTDYNQEDSDFDSYNVEAHLIDKRGDELRTRFRFVKDTVRQVETGIQFLLSDYMKIGYYSRYDDLNAEFIENRVGLRFTSSCNCWVFDVDVSDRINPDETSLVFNIELLGLGEFGNTFFSDDRRNRS